jgi:oligoendopeptidase F
MEYKATWNLDQVLHGAGSSYEKIDKQLNHILDKIQKLPTALEKAFTQYQELLEEIHEAGSLITCLSSTDISDMRATQAEAKYNTISAALDSASQKIDAQLLALSDKEFQDLLKKVPNITFAVEERRRLAKEKMPLDKELLVNDLSVSGHSAYTTLYYSFMGNLRFGEKKLNLSRLEKLFSHSDRAVRKDAFEDMEKELTHHEPVFGQILNNIVDFRLSLYKQRNWKSYLQETLAKNRLQEKTLTKMWDVVSQNKQPLVQYMKAKAQLLGLKQLSWCDVDAPIGSPDDAKIPWEAGCNNILEQFGKVSPRLAEFSEKALKKGWVDAKPGDKKRAGGFCRDIPLLKESRILMTYTDTFDSQSTLAHELGHAFHSHVIYDKPPLLQNYPMNIAEAASTMCEMIVADSALKNATSPKQKLLLLDDKITSYLAFSMNIHSRFLFETHFHEKRQKGFLTPDQINDLMVDSQKTAYANALDSYLPHFWCYKMHFYFTDAIFYNWPYTFGYLFSLGTYNILLNHDFENCYIALLKDSGSMNVEDLAKKHLGADLQKPDFWQGAIDLLNANITDFLRIARFP